MLLLKIISSGTYGCYMRRNVKVLGFDLKTMLVTETAMQTTLRWEYVRNWAELTARARDKTT